MPRAIAFTAVLYYLGVLPELIGSGRGLAEALKQKLPLTRFYLNFKVDIVWAGRFLNKENLELLTKINPAWRQVAEDVKLIEKNFRLKLGPKTDADFLHRNLTSNVYYLWRAKKPLNETISQSGKIRQSLG